MVRLRLVSLLTVLPLVACGGGSGSGSPASPAATLDSTSQSYSTFVLNGNAVTATPDPGALTFSNFSATPVVKATVMSTGGIQSVTFTASDATHGGLTYTFEAPSSIGTGAHDSTVQVQVCVDAGCMSQVASFTLSVTYTVNDTITVSGANGYTLKAVTVPHTTSLAGNDQQSTLFLGIAADAAVHPLSVAALEPASGALSYSVQAVGDHVALAGDGATLYAWPTSAVSMGVYPAVSVSQLSLGLAAGPLVLNVSGPVLSVAAAPGAPQTLAVTLENGNLAEIFDGTVARSGTLQSIDNQYLNLQWLSASSLYLLNQFVAVAPTDYQACTADSSAAGLSMGACGADAGSAAGTFLPFGFAFANGLGYGRTGTVVDPNTWSTVATLSLPAAGTIEAIPLPDATLNRLFLIEQTSGGCLLQSYTLSTHAPLASLALPTDASGKCLDGGFGLVSFGASGLAINTGTAIMLITGVFVTG